MQTTTDFFNWFYSGLNGLGGWFLFVLLALAALIYVLYDVSRRRLVATGWKMGVVLLALLLLPAVIYRFASTDTRQSLDQFKEVIFYLGLLGGILPPVLAAGYYVTFRGIVTCDKGHQYDAILGECPECSREKPRVDPYPPVGPYIPEVRYPTNPPPRETQIPLSQPKPTVPAWLVGGAGRNYQLCRGVTTIGRNSRNDIQLSEDDTISREHAKIMESNGHFRLVDLGSSVGTFVNGRRLREAQMLENGDDIRFGTNTVFRFTSGR